MKKFLTVLALLVCGLPQVYAQTDTPEKKDGSVTVHQSDDISKLVNGSGKSSTETGSGTPAPKEPVRSEERSTPRSESRSESSRSEARPERERKSEAEIAREKERRMKEREAREAERDKKIRESEAAAGATMNSKKVMSNGRRLMGYRVQVFAGRNTREDREKAIEAGKKIKGEMPGQPVYVHFYSPRWVCRIGNFAKEEEANNLLKKVKNMGYKSACVVKTPVTVSVRRR